MHWLTTDPVGTRRFLAPRSFTFQPARSRTGGRAACRQVALSAAELRRLDRGVLRRPAVRAAPPGHRQRERRHCHVVAIVGRASIASAPAPAPPPRRRERPRDCHAPAIVGRSVDPAALRQRNAPAAPGRGRDNPARKRATSAEGAGQAAAFQQAAPPFCATRVGRAAGEIFPEQRQSHRCR